MNEDLSRALRNAKNRQEREIARLIELLRIPSISMSSRHSEDVQRAADWLVADALAAGFQRAKKFDTARHPMVYAEWLHPEPGAPTLLCYGHYDVQPPDPLDQWISPPFEPTIRDGNLFARGVADDKGQVIIMRAAIGAWLADGGLPCSVKWLIEGEEEISSPHIGDFVEEHRQLLACDAVLICDQPMIDDRNPVILYGVRGSAYFEIELKGPAQDMHSGLVGGAIENPFNALVRMLARLMDDERRIAVPGFYGDVKSLSKTERAIIAQSPATDEVVQQLTGVPMVAGEAGYTTAERMSVRPSLEIHGMPGGFTDAGKKTVIPSIAKAKVGMRLVPDQDPDDIAAKFEAFLRSIGPPTVTLDVQLLGKAHPCVFDADDVAIRAAVTAYSRIFENRPTFMRGGGSLPIVHDFKETLGVPVVMLGFGLPDDNIHAPNEKLSIKNFHRGVDTIIHYLEEFANACRASKKREHQG